MRNLNKVLLYCCIVILFMISCDSNRVYDSYRSLSNNYWHKDSIVSFKIQAPDTINPYNLLINLRNNNEYKYNNLFLIATVKYPKGKVTKDTLEYKMANPDGTLLGTGFSDTKENRLWYKGYKTPFVFSELGDYSIEIQHAMRENGKADGIIELEGITEVGFRIENQPSHTRN